MFLAEFLQYSELRETIGFVLDSPFLLINLEGNTDSGRFRHGGWDGTNPVPPEYQWPDSIQGCV